MAPDITAQQALQEEFAAFGSFEPFFGDTYTTTADHLKDYLSQNARANVPPAEPNSWEMRIGAAKFVVPPINIRVNRAFQTGSLTGGAIRQLIPPKFNSGHSETVIGITLYFPGQEDIWGFAGNSLTIDFNAPGHEDKIDGYLSSLRGLITAFRYSPILPITNAYLNETFDITAVALKTLTVSTMTDEQGIPFPFCLQVDLECLAFDHKIYLPMVNQLSDAMDWGRYRQYVGRAAFIMEQAVDKSFATTYMADNSPAISTLPDTQRSQEALAAIPDPADFTGKLNFSVTGNLADATNLEIYYPPSDPATIVPDLLTDIDFLPKTAASAPGNEGWWNALLTELNISQKDLGTWDQIITSLQDQSVINQFKLFKAFLSGATAAANAFSPQVEQQWIDHQVQALGKNPSSVQVAQVTRDAQKAYFLAIYSAYIGKNSFLQNLFNIQSFIRGTRLIYEWEVPMTKLPLNQENVVVLSVSGQMVNNFSRAQLNMVEAPAYQHIGGLGTTIEVNLHIKGETDLTNLRLMFDRINGLSRLEHGHAVLGFLGIRNIISAIMGTKYVIPQSFTTSTVNGMPHNYLVKMVFSDFDIFQQKREMLSSEQQSQLIEHFGKANPFLRLKQVWSAFNAYPDFPLAVRDGDGKIVGTLDPDYYFKSFSTLDRDIATGTWDNSPNGSDTTGQSNATSNYNIVHHLGQFSDNGTTFSIGLNGGYFDVRTNDTVHMGGLAFNEPHAGNQLTSPTVPGLTPASGHVTPTFTKDSNGQFSHTDKSGNAPTTSVTGLVDNNFKLMMEDLHYRDNDGRMVKAFPSYMLWLIDEGGLFAGMKLFDNFYGLQSVLDFSIVDNEDVMGSTLILRVSNLYSRLSTTYSQQIDAALFPALANVGNPIINSITNLTNGATNGLIPLDTINLQPGVRVHLRVGYGSDPNLLETVFNGVITQVQSGDVMTITCQSDAIELGAVVNNTNTSGTSGDIDGALMSGLYFSEPRDLMVRLLSMGGSTVDDAIALATGGEIFSENRWGIRHFGRVIYDAMTSGESTRTQARDKYLKGQGQRFNSDIANIAGADPKTIGSDALISGGAMALGGPVAAGVAAFTNPAAGLNISAMSIVGDLWTNFAGRRDTEIFKRNIYPGNGTGIGQFSGGDLGDGGTATAFFPFGIGADGSIPDSQIGNTQTFTSAAAAATGVDDALSGVQGGGSSAGNLVHNLLSLMGITKTDSTSQTEPGASSANTGLTGWLFQGIFGEVGHALTAGYGGPFAEVSFKAKTYMKSVWELFLICAALVPNYVVAVRPWEDRSTVFYGKPHWAYTSGILPVTTGPTIDSLKATTSARSQAQLEERIQQGIQAAMAAGNSNASAQQLYNQISGAGANAWKSILSGGTGSAEPSGTTNGVSWGGGSIEGLPLTADNGAVIPVRTGPMGIEMHLPTSGDLQTDIDQHIQLLELPIQYQHPFYMDRGNAVGGTETSQTAAPTTSDQIYTETVISGQNPLAPGHGSAFAPMEPHLEQFYMAMRWDTNNNYPSALMGKKILVFCQSTKKGVICTPGDYGPSGWVNRVGGVSPDAWIALGQPAENAICWFGFVPDSTSVGPIQWDGTATFNGTTLPINQTLPTLSKVGKGQGLVGITSAGGTVGNDSSAQAASDKAAASEGIVPDNSISWFPADSKNLNPLQYAAETGYRTNVPVDFGTITDPKTGDIYVDTLGQQARKIYSKFRTDEQANSIWQQFRKQFPGESKNQDAFTSVPGQPASQFHSVMTQFMEFMWGDPYNRAWVVLTANAAVNIGEPLPGGWADPANWITLGITDLFGGGKTAWEFGMAEEAFKYYVTQSPNYCQTWMIDNIQEGSSQTSILGRVTESFISDTGKAIKTIWGSITSIIGGIVGALRVQLSSLVNGINIAQWAGDQANVLNGVYNDSIYFDSSKFPVGSLNWLCDNPFTREYGEPVVEIREPFQRLHMINSFQHIIANGIIENIEGVATVVTATTDNGHPYTAYFDKGAPSERQLEKTVDTGLQWNAPQGFGAGIPILGEILHPIKALESWCTHFNNGDNATDATRVARWHLKESLKNIYMGQIIILGNAQIRTHDLIYLNDNYERMYGLFEVEQVVHEFSPETGFITSITPNAIVMINDPAKWQWGSLTSRQGAAQALRNTIRQTLGRSNQFPASFTANDIADSYAAQLLGTTQFTGGVGALAKDYAAMGGYQGLQQHPDITKTLDQVGQPSFNAQTPLGIQSSTLGKFLSWPIYAYLRDHFFDAHQCYINYLNKNGAPMDAGLSYNYGSAVGQPNVLTLFGDSLGLNLNLSEGGETVVSLADLLSNIGWQPKDILKTRNALTLQQQYALDQVLQLSGKGETQAIGQLPDVQSANVVVVEDGMTLIIDRPFMGSTRVQLQFLSIPTAVTAYKASAAHLEQLLSQSNGAIVLRVNPEKPHPTNAPSTLLATAFWSIPDLTPTPNAIDRNTLVSSYASNPLINWDDYLPQGSAYTLNWQMILDGFAHIDATQFGGTDVPPSLFNGG